MPDAFSGVRLESDQRIREQVVAGSVGSVEVEGGGTRRNKDQASLLVKGHSSPVIGAANVLPGVFRPRFVAELSGMRDSVERPAQTPGSEVVRANMARGRGQRLTHNAAENKEVLVHDARGCGGDGESSRLAAETLP